MVAKQKVRTAQITPRQFLEDINFEEIVAKSWLRGRCTMALKRQGFRVTKYREVPGPTHDQDCIAVNGLRTFRGMQEPPMNATRNGLIESFDDLGMVLSTHNVEIKLVGNHISVLVVINRETSTT